MFGDGISQECQALYAEGICSSNPIIGIDQPYHEVCAAQCEQLEARMQQTAEEAAKTARAEGEAAARAEAEEAAATARAEAVATAEEAAAAARAEAEALRQQLEEYKAAAKRAAPEGDDAAAEPRASKRRR